jgi:hypothetical protein
MEGYDGTDDEMSRINRLLKNSPFPSQINGFPPFRLLEFSNDTAWEEGFAGQEGPQ